MAILRWTNRPFTWQSPLAELNRLRQQMDDVFQNWSGHLPGLSRSAGVYPLINIAEDDENLFVTAELPGVAASDLEITVVDNNLTIRGERKIPSAEKEVNFHRKEREAGFFRRVVSLPVRIDSEKVAGGLEKRRIDHYPAQGGRGQASSDRHQGRITGKGGDTHGKRTASTRKDAGIQRRGTDQIGSRVRAQCRYHRIGSRTHSDGRHARR